MKISRQGMLVLKAFLDRASESMHGYELMQAAGVSSGTLYPMLIRFEEEGLLASSWEQADPQEEGRPRRRLYRITGAGQRAAQELLSDFGLKVPV